MAFLEVAKNVDFETILTIVVSGLKGLIYYVYLQKKGTKPMAWDSCTIPMKKKEKGIGDYCTSLEFGPRQVYIYRTSLHCHNHTCTVLVHCYSPIAISIHVHPLSIYDHPQHDRTSVGVWTRTKYFLNDNNIRHAVKRVKYFSHSMM